MKTDLISGILVLGITGLAWNQSRVFSYYGRIFVDWTLLFLVSLGTALLIKGCIKGEKVRFWAKNAHKGQVIGLLSGLFVYLMLTPKLGFLFSGVIIFSSLCLMLIPGKKKAPKNWLTALGMGFFMTVIFYLIFKYGLLVPLPTGSFWVN